MTYDGSVAASAPRTAVILAAGNGERLSQRAPLKPLLKVGGLTLIERTLLTLHRAGIRDFRVVVGAKSDRMVAAANELERLRGLQITFVPCPDWELGNGVSLARGAASIDEPFLVSMSDHVTDGASARALIEASAARPDTPKLATDPRPDGVFDLTDATKVRTRDGRIEAIGKDLTSFDQIDTGLFYFPAGSGARLEAQRAAGARQVSDHVRALAAEAESGGFEVVPVADGVWQDVDTPAMAREAEKRLLRGVIKPTDGPVSRYLNRPISTRLTRLLARFDVSPNAVTTFVFLLTMGAAVMAAGASTYLTLALAGVLFQIASIIDGCDGELSRFMFKGTRFGAWYDTLTDNVRYAAFFTALGVHSFRHTGHPVYLWAVGLFILLAIYFVTMMSRRLIAENAPGTHLVIAAKAASFVQSERAGWFERVVWPLRFVVKQDVIALAVMLGLLFAVPAVTFWLGLVGLVVMTIQVQRVLRPQAAATEGATSLSQNGSFLAFLVGMGILGWILSRAPLAEIAATLSTVGVSAFLVFGIALVWLLLNTLSLRALVDRQVGVGTLLENRLAGEAINNLVPLANVAGEPYKIKHLAGFLPLEVATHAVVSDKIINTISGLLFFAVAGTLSVGLVELPRSIVIGMAVLAFVAVLASVGLAVVVLSELQGRALGRVMRALGLAADYRSLRLRPKTFMVALAYNLAGRTAILLEVYALLRLLHVTAGPAEVLSLGAVVNATSILFFVIPQGIGVSEAGVAGTFVLLGLPVELGVTYALLRRGRIIFWALVGLVVLGVRRLLTSLHRPVTVEAAR